MTDRSPVEPALKAEEWKAAMTEDGTPLDDWFASARVAYGRLDIIYDCGTSSFGVEQPLKLIALANAALPDDDPRKITHARVAELRDALGCFQADRGRLPDDAATERFLDALESYLPPT